MRQSYPSHVGERHGRLSLLHAASTGQRCVFWCLCDCGNVKAICAHDILRKRSPTSSCGCIMRRQPGGEDLRREKQTWWAMTRRCRPNACAQDRAVYFDRGITVCERWKSFANFVSDMGPRPAGTSIDRIDNDRGYEPGNCRWATPQDQTDNRRCTRTMDAFGERKSLSQWAKDARCVVRRTALVDRWKSGWVPERAITAPASRPNALPC